MTIKTETDVVDYLVGLGTRASDRFKEGYARAAGAALRGDDPMPHCNWPRNADGESFHRDPDYLLGYRRGYHDVTGRHI